MLAIAQELAGPWIRDVPGLVLFAFVIVHLFNLSVGLFGVDASLGVGALSGTLVRSWVGAAVLSAALLAHVAQTIDRIANLPTFRMPAAEAVRLASALMVPFLLLPHVLAIRFTHVALGADDTYSYILASGWTHQILWHVMLVVVAWWYLCTGPGEVMVRRFNRFRNSLTFLALLLPLAALAGFMVSGREIAAGGALSTLQATLEASDPGAARLGRAVAVGEAALLLALGLLVATISYRVMRLRAAPRMTVRYTGLRSVSAPCGVTLLDVSRMHGIAHAAACGGRGRCSTCRVRRKSAGTLPPPDYAEAAILERIGAPADVRLGCQLRPAGDLIVSLSVNPGNGEPETVVVEDDNVERVLVLMFLDMRDSTKHMEAKLPYDVVYILNEFFAATGNAIAMNGGAIDNIMGDGLLAIFGVRDGPEVGARQALQAARAVDLALDHFNARMAAELSHPMEVGIGIHAGPLLLGRIGWGDAFDLTVIGHAVNAANRLESLTKEKHCQLIISREVADFAGWREAVGAESVEVRGIETPIDIIRISRGRDLPPQVLSPDWSQ